MNPPIANYDKQVWAIISQNTDSLAVNVTAVKQTDSSGYGPAYLLNGYTDRGYWYQVGIAWHWVTTSDIGYSDGFDFFVQMYDGNANDAQVVNVLSPISVNGGDKVELQLSLSQTYETVSMSVHDWATGAEGQYGLPAYGASQFLGSLSNTYNPTSVLLEAYGRSLVCGLSEVTFSSTSINAQVGIRIDEWNFTGVPVQSRFTGNPEWSFPMNGQSPQGTSNSCVTFLGTTACDSAH